MPIKAKKAAEAAPDSPLDARLSVVYRKTGDLIPYARNARTHSEEQVQQIAGSIREFGFTNPILLDGKNGIIAGHGRLAAAQLVQLPEVPCIDISWLSETQKKALVLADNRLALNAGWDEDMLRLELQEIKDDGFGMEIMGFMEQELEKILTDKGAETPEEDLPPLAAKATSVLGDIWILRDHRVICGDSTQLSTYQNLLGKELVDLVFTDPPYGVDFERGKFQGREKKFKDGNQHKPIANDELKGEDLTGFLVEAFSNALSYSKQCSIYCWSPSMKEGYSILDALTRAGWKIQSQIVWKKTPFVLGRSDYHWQHELCWYGFKEGKGGHSWYGGRDQATVWEVPKPTKVDLHPTMKPVKLAEIALNNSTKGGDIVLDMFGGSGSTLIACETLKRSARVIELEPLYVDVIIKRWEQLTGEKAIHEATGKTFAEVCGDCNWEGDVDFSTSKPEKAKGKKAKK